MTTRQREVIEGVTVDFAPDWICYICGHIIKRKRRHHKHLGLSSDHLIPKSKGGENKFSNYALAHKFCNHRRGSEPLTEDLKNQIKKEFEELRSKPWAK